MFVDDRNDHPHDGWSCQSVILFLFLVIVVCALHRTDLLIPVVGIIVLATLFSLLILTCIFYLIILGFFELFKLISRNF